MAVSSRHAGDALATQDHEESEPATLNFVGQNLTDKHPHAHGRRCFDSRGQARAESGLIPAFAACRTQEDARFDIFPSFSLRSARREWCKQSHRSCVVEESDERSRPEQVLTGRPSSRCQESRKGTPQEISSVKATRMTLSFRFPPIHLCRQRPAFLGRLTDRQFLFPSLFPTEMLNSMFGGVLP